MRARTTWCCSRHAGHAAGAEGAQPLLAVATGKGRRGLDEALRSRAAARLFDATRTADETAGKPHPLMLQELMAEFGVTPERTLMIGDTTHDLQLARERRHRQRGRELRRARARGLCALAPLHVACPRHRHLRGRPLPGRAGQDRPDRERWHGALAYCAIFETCGFLT
jgi:hypothetical protein